MSTETENEFTRAPGEEIREAALENKPFSVKNPPWNLWTALGYWILSVLLIFLFGAIAAVAYSGITGVSIEAIASLKDAGGINAQFLAVVPAHLITIILGYFLVTGFGRADLKKTLGMEWGGFRWWHMILILVGFYTLGMHLTAVFGESENSLEKAIQASKYAVFIIAILATFSAPIVEEVVYRGVLYGSFEKRGGTGAALVFVTLLFAAVHVPQYWGDWAVIIGLVVLSLALTMVRALTGNLLPCIFVHFVFNAVQSIALIASKYLPQTPLVN